ncbi:FIST N-terminal domain-containing protein [Desulfonatronospira sp. MSAO_Bac3]|uniref:FIST signal transduction protein n=1 Tax=Desulfonatronospira sp. MSAO_Bac3 TaxID=2293857 RepID=UPI000FF2B28D|nr:FIST N-terminal domain-containing protein [Desulfonatronospira sp. MSAO_Bac3]RQD77118.1 MAG: histidine kinase [Desulfonatronospira sp. MSAO_Bac3]
MILRVCRKGSVESLQSMLQEVQNHGRVKSILILACDANGFTPENVDPVLQECGLPLLGGVFPQIIAEGENLEKGTIVAGLFYDTVSLYVPGLSDDDRIMDDAVDEALTGVDVEDRTFFVFVDGLSSRISAFIDGLFNNLGLMPNYIGGGAGSLSFEQKPCLFTNLGLKGDGAVVGVSEVRSGIGVAHGWHPITKTMKVTESEKNRVISLNWEPAFQVYKNAIKEQSGLSFDEKPFFDIAKAHPLGIVKLDAEMIVRDPLFTENDELVCVGEVPVNSFVYILRGNMDSLIEGAVQARDNALNNYHGDRNKASMLFMDCISRVLFMGEEFKKELQAADCGLTTFGALTIGEIANTGDAYLEFYNKTAVAGILGDPHAE